MNSRKEISSLVLYLDSTSSRLNSEKNLVFQASIQIFSEETAWQFNHWIGGKCFFLIFFFIVCCIRFFLYDANIECLSEKTVILVLRVKLRADYLNKADVFLNQAQLVLYKYEDKIALTSIKRDLNNIAQSARKGSI